eukprot:3934115-Rhodomonas_salina.5
MKAVLEPVNVRMSDAAHTQFSSTFVCRRQHITLWSRTTLPQGSRYLSRLLHSTPRGPGSEAKLLDTQAETDHRLAPSL